MATFSDPRPVILDAYGKPVIGGVIYFYEAGTVDTLKNIYADEGLTTLLPNPLSLDANGRVPQLYYTTNKYKIRVVDGNDVDVWTADYVDGNVSATVMETGFTAFTNNLTSLRSLDYSTYPIVNVLGNVSGGDGGGGIYKWIPSITTADDNGWYIQMALGGSGRYVRQLMAGEESLNIRIWSGTNLSPIDSYYASASAFCATVRKPLYWPAGTYAFADGVVFAGTNLRMIVDSGCVFDSLIPANITFSCPTEIRSILPLCTSNGVLLINASSEVNEIDARWYSGSFACAYQANIVGLPVAFKQNYTVDAATAMNVSSGLHIYDSVTITIPDDSQFSVNSTFQVDGKNRRVFIESDADVTSSRAYCGYNVPDAKAWWWGWGFMSGNDQALALKRALKSCHAAGDTVLKIDTLFGSQAILSDATGVPDGESYVPVYAYSPIKIGNGGILGNIMPLNSLSDQVFSVSGTGVLNRIAAAQLTPEWFGASYLATDNNNALLLTFKTAAINRTPVSGSNLTYSIGSTIAYTLGSYDVLDICDMVIEPNGSYNSTTYPWLLTLITGSGGGDVFIDHCIFGNGTDPALNCLYVDTFFSRITNSTFFYGTSIKGEDYQVSNNQFYGAATVSFYSAKVAGIVEGNSFSSSGVFLEGDKSIKSGRDIAMLENIIFSNNSVINTDTIPTRGCVYLRTNYYGTLVSSVNVTDNVFGGNVSNDNETVPMNSWLRARIWNVAAGGGSWCSDVYTPNTANAGITFPGGIPDLSQWSAYWGKRHTMIIRDNTYAFRVGMNYSAPNLTGDQVNYLPATSGSYMGSIPLQGYSDMYSITNSPYTAIHLRILTHTITDGLQIFQLIGDTKTVFGLYETVVTKSTKISDLDFVNYPFVASMAITGTTGTGYPAFEGVILANATRIAKLQWPEQMFDSSYINASNYTSAKYMVNFKIYEEN